MEQGSCDIGLIGLAVMGQNLVLNMNVRRHAVDRRPASCLRTAWA